MSAALLITLAQHPNDLQSPENTVLVQRAISARPSNLQSTMMEVAIYADVVKVRRQPSALAGSAQAVLSHNRTRGTVKRFSRKSRKRMIERCAMLRSVDQGFFCTPTYPDDVEHSGVKAKRDLKALQQRITRRFPSAGGIWRIEIKPRLSGSRVGEFAPHFHILLFGVPMHEVLFRRWFQRAWSQIVYETDSPPIRVRTQVERINGRRHAAAYASKYAAKEDKLENCDVGEDFVTWGRRWGVFGALSFDCQMIMTLTADRVVELRRMVARWMKARGSRYAKRLARGSPYVGFTALGLGDLSLPESGLFSATIMRILLDAIA